MAVEERTTSETDDLVEYYLTEQEYHGKSERTLRFYRRVLCEFTSFLGEERACDVQNAERRDCMAWVHDLRESHAPSTIATYASYVNRFYAYMGQIDVLSDNPMGLVVSEMDESIEKDPMRRELSVDQLRVFLDGIAHPLDRALVMTLAKTGIRVGELCNLDLRDVHVDAPWYEAYGPPPRTELSARPDTLFVPAEPSLGNRYNGEVRSASNKRKRDTFIPVDRELKAELARYLAIRPDCTSDAEPLFCKTGSDWGERVSTKSVRYVVRRHAQDAGWYRAGANANENVTPHYFRHFFTTHMRDRTGDRGVVKYLRGDVAEDIIDTYTHDWGDRVRDQYLANVYSLVGGPEIGQN